MASSSSTAAPGALPPMIGWYVRAPARAVQLVWLLLQLGALALVVAATPAMYDEYRSVCPQLVCDRLPQLNAGSTAWLQGFGVRINDYAVVMVTVEWVSFLLWAGLGALLIWKRPHEPVALLIAFLGIFLGSALFLGVLDDAGAHVDVIARAGTFITYSSYPLVLALFPDGRWVPRWARWSAAGGVAYAALSAFMPARLAWLGDAVGTPLALAVYASLLVAQVSRYRHASTVIQRQQTKWLVATVGLLILNLVVATAAYLTGLFDPYQPIIMVFCYCGSALVVLALGVAVLRYRLFDLEPIVNRALVYAGLSGSVIAIYALIVGGLGMALRTHSVAVSLLAAGVVAVVFQPLRERLQRGVNRLIYGERDEPYAVLARLGRHLDASQRRETLLSTIAETVATALKLPYVAVALRQAEGDRVVASCGSPPDGGLESLPLTFQGEQVGALLVAPRAGEGEVRAADRRLLQDLARQAGVAAHAVRLGAALQRSREQLVTAREEERRRLRRDLHDGLGPALASQALTLDAATLVLERDPESAASLLREATRQSQAAVQEIRRLVHALRPPALDDLGLTGALRELARQIAGTRLDVVITAPQPLQPLPAAVEVATYRIAQEALTNVVRHAGASVCRVSIELEDTLHLSIVDNGVGIAIDRRAGVGLASMRERAEELGGTCVVAATPAGGTTVSCQLPLPVDDRAE